MDNLDLKVMVREVARAHGIDVLMMSDFGHAAHVQWNLFSVDRAAPLAHQATDAELYEALRQAREGQRSDVFRFIERLCGVDFATDTFKTWVDGHGEQPTSSLPQAGSTAMASGGIGGKELALRVLGHLRSGRIVYDLLDRTVVSR